MQKILLIFLSISAFSMLEADTYVNGYYRSNGTYVQGYYKSDADERE